jgi:hypothetical protein
MQTGSLEHHCARRIARPTIALSCSGSPWRTSPKRALGITRGCVDQDALHRSVGLIRFTVNPLSQGRASVTTVEAQLTDQSVGERVQKDVLRRDFCLAQTTLKAAPILTFR